MESKLNSENISIKDQEYYSLKASEDKKFTNMNSTKSVRSANSRIYHRKKLHEILDENNFILTLDESGNATIPNDNVFIIPNNSNLIVKVFNGSKISKNACIVTNSNMKNIYETKIKENENQDNLSDNSLNEISNSESNFSEKEEKETASAEAEKNDFSSPRIDENLLNEDNYKNLSVHDLKEISKLYNLKSKSFSDSSSYSDTKVKLHEKIDPRKIQEFENHLVYSKTYDTDIYFIIPCKKPGPLSFFVLYEGSNSLLAKGNENSNNSINDSSSESFEYESSLNPFFKNINLHSPEITVLIEPKLKMGNKEIDVESLSMQTILSKSLGKLDEWEHYFKEASLLNYNIIHFTPIQMIGKSDSLYCLKDQTEINDAFFDLKYSKEEKFKMVKNKVSNLKTKYHISCLVDIVLNHTAIYSEWLLKHPDAGYNLDNCPYLTVSYELDKLILDYSHRFSEKKVCCKSAPFVYNENDLNDLIAELSNEIHSKNFEEYFLLSIEIIISDFISFFKSYKKNFEEYLNKKKYLANKLLEKKLNFSDENHIYQLILESADNYGAERYGVKINTEFISILLLKDGFSENQFLAEVKKYLNRLNEDWRNKSKEFVRQAIENTKASIRYEFIQLKRYKVTDRKRLVENYFTTFEQNNKKAIFACNGWLFGVSDPTVNFAKYGFWNYFNRSIVIWGDCVKLNFGDKPEDSPYLWQHMTEYVTGMAKIFDGFRLDNAHSTPIFLAEYLMKKAREVNPNLVIIAELFAGTKEREIEFVNRIGINLLIREIIYCGNTEELSDSLYKFGGGNERVLGKLSQNCAMILDSQKTLKYKNLSGRKPKSILFDVTHDNPTLFEKYANLALNLTYLCCNSMNGSSIGSTRGFDQLFPYQPSVVKESRLYAYDDSFENLLDKHKIILGNHRDLDKMQTKSAAPKAKSKLESKDKKNSKENVIVDTSTSFEFNPSHSGINISPGKVCLAISCNGWKPDIFLEKIHNNLWRTKLQLNDGTYEYKFVIDGTNWIHDKTKPTVKDKSNIINNQIIVGQSASSYTPSVSQNQPIKFNEFYINIKDLKLIRREMNYLRRVITELSNYELSEFFIWRDRDVLSIYRGINYDFLENEDNKNFDFDGYALVSRTGFERNPNSLVATKIELPGVISELMFFSNITVPNFDMDKIRSDSKLVGVDSNIFFSKNMKNLWDIAKINRLNGKDIIDFHSLRPNTNILLKIKFEDNVKNSILKLNEKINYLENNESSMNLIKNADICDLNHALFKCEQEELANTANKRGNYEFQDFGKLVYAGISHLHLILQKAKQDQTLVHKVFDNVRAGDWLLKYSLDRLKDSRGLTDLANFLLSNIYPLYTSIPAYLKPHYITRIIDVLYNYLVKYLFSKIEESMDLDDKGFFFKSLLIANLQFIGFVESSKFKDKSNNIIQSELSISAGLPFFSTEYMRCWGRDTFISFKGLLLIPGFYKEAKQIMIHFASTMRHGLIPNLLDSGNNPRFNARDAAIKDYVKYTDDYDFLNHEINMLFLDDDVTVHFDKLKRGEKKVMRIQDIILAILTKHVNGIEFREWKAGKQIDEHMKDEGFDIKIYFDHNTGFVYGGNNSNCGTWMDKMGSSAKANNKGFPSTPRNGADVELMGLIYSVVSYFNYLHNFDKKYMNQNYLILEKIKIENSNKLLLLHWAESLKENFEKNFFVSKKMYLDGTSTKENYYRDYVSNTEKRYQEYQLRPNFLIAMAVAPELFSKEKALKALEMAEKYLLVDNAMGVRTLDFEDKFYKGSYDNANDGNDYFIAHGFNYHNGPEWVWPIGYYIIAKCHFNNFLSKSELKRYICSILIPHYKNIMNDPWRGIPELTDKDNKYCLFSCRTQAWSIATILDGLETLLDI